MTEPSAAARLDELGLGQGHVLPATQRSDSDHPSLPRDIVVHHHLGRRSGARPQCSEPVALPGELPVHTLGHFIDLPARDLGHAQPAEPVLVTGEGDSLPVRRHGKGTLTHPPRRSAVLVRFVDQRRIADVHVEPSSVVAKADQSAVGHEPDLLDGRRRPSVGNGRSIERDALDARRIPRHVGHVPRLPHHVITCRVASTGRTRSPRCRRRCARTLHRRGGSPRSRPRR